MPQIAQLADTYSSQIFWLLVIFGLVFVVIGRGMVPKVMGTVALRDTQIAQDLAAATAARDAADRQEEAWRVRENENRANAQALVREAKARASEKSDRRLAKAQQAIDAKLAEAEQRIAAAREGAASELATVAVEAAREIVSKLAGVSVPQKTAQSAVKEALNRG